MRSAMIAAGFAALLGSSATQAVPPPGKPKLIVAISVDQFSSELYRRYLDSYTGGLRTLSSGTAFPIGYQSHAATETCPGHSTILTGMHPEHTGIVANSWFDVKTGSNIYCVQAPGSSDLNARGPQNMKVGTLGDWIKAVEPGARSYAVSGKDRAAITMAGKHADGVYWWYDGVGFTTSSFAGPAGPAVTAPADAFNKALFSHWKASPPPLYPAASATCQAMEKPVRFGQIDLSGHVPRAPSRIRSSSRRPTSRTTCAPRHSSTRPSLTSPRS
ncbi:alkaline phosphatase family protein [Sphingomonas chungangi]|uniref:alkaline phosphatase family protein n=1 Tax=Sphingomonas chungangi TaxID=2683589 RepID=UPI001FE9303C|nr:alkaline phosphatase family protein [Sphingomonas chungangi]